ncbi:MAG: hypothetical protein V4696_10955 [Pseudomonadota bacterium]
MASPLPTGKQSVSLATSGAKVSRIRRDPPPKTPEVVVAERDERDARMVAIGIITFALALVVIGMAVMSWMGWTPRSYRLDV